MELNFFCAGVVFGAGAVFTLLLIWGLIAPWVQCFLTGAPLSLIQLLGMRLRRSPVKLLVDAHIGLVQGRHTLICSPHFTMQYVESVYLANPGRIFTSHDLMNLVIEDWPKHQAAIEKQMANHAAHASQGHQLHQ